MGIYWILYFILRGLYNYWDMVRCRICGSESVEIPSRVLICRNCVLSSYSDEYLEVHRRWRASIGLRERPSDVGEGIRCTYCVNECVIGEGEAGYCGVIVNRGGRITHVSGSLETALLFYYYDPIPTNCVAAHVCPASTEVGYPDYSVSEDIEHGYYNLAVFFGGCNLDCLFCQNIEHKHMVVGRAGTGRYMDVDELLKKAYDDRVTCICFFGGDPTPHTLYTLKFSRGVIEYASRTKAVKRLCWETNGLENPRLFQKIVEYAFKSGGIVKIDWKAYTPEIYSLLTGINGYKALKRIKENVKYALSIDYGERGYPLLTVSTLVVPHYIGYEEVYGIASYIAEYDDETPYVLLAFAPHHLMNDIPTTSRAQMMSCLEAAIEAGLKNIHIGNYWLLR